MAFEYCNNLRLTVFGQSHSRAIGAVLDGLPYGFSIDESALRKFCDRRKATDEISTARKEKDEVEILSGLLDGKTCGSPVAFTIRNEDVRSEDYESVKETPRPSHADYVAMVKYSGFSDLRGGGHFSGRLTAPLCVAGGIAKQILSKFGIEVGAHLLSVKDVKDVAYDPVDTKIKQFDNGEFPVLDKTAEEKMRSVILSAKKDGDSVGGVIECAITGLPVGLGSPNFDGVENVISHLAFAVPAVKGIEFGNGFAAAATFGSENNDAFAFDGEKVVTLTNNAGGINGGITNGMPVIFKVAMKPTPSISKTQNTLNLKTGETQDVNVGGRHDPCVAVRAVPVIESVAALAILDLFIDMKKDELSQPLDC